jgi:predicted phosphodiesterase
VRVAALYDVHGNLPALEAVLEGVEREGVDVIVSGGDVIAGPFARECLELLLGRSDVRFVSGNADRRVVEVARGAPDAEHNVTWVVARLDPQHVEALAAFEPVVSLDVDGLGPTLFCHATPGSDTAFFLETTDPAIAESLLDETAEETIVCGHSHMQFDLRIGRWRVVNAGSVGMPYEPAPGAYWALLGPDVELRRTEYDLVRAAERFRATDHPQADELARENVLIVPSREEALVAFEPLVGHGA